MIPMALFDCNHLGSSIQFGAVPFGKQGELRFPHQLPTAVTVRCEKCGQSAVYDLRFSGGS